MLRGCTATIATLCLLTAPAVAQAATKSVSMGPPPTAAETKTMHNQLGSDSNNFYPAKISIRVGDKVSFAPFGFHNAQFPKKGSKPSALFIPTAPVSGAVDAAGAPFWFNGQPTVGFDPALLKSSFGKTVTYNGTKRVDSGLPLADKPKPFVVKFTKRGTHTYYCSVHPRMKGTVTVKSKSAKVPSAKADAARVKKQLAADLKAAQALTKTTAPTNTVFLGASDAAGRESYGIFPKALTVPVGTTVKFATEPTSREVHTATFGPGNPEKEPTTYLGTLAKTFEGPGPFDGRATYPSDPPGTLASLTPTLHGNGFWNSGVLDADSNTPPPTNNSVTFGAAGTYTYYCLIHAFMTGTVTAA